MRLPINEGFPGSDCGVAIGALPLTAGEATWRAPPGAPRCWGADMGCPCDREGTAVGGEINEGE